MAAPIQTLESRRLMSTGVDPVGAEFGVGGPVKISTFESQSVDFDAAGNYVVAWIGVDFVDDEVPLGIQARRYAADGTPLGDAFVVNTITDEDQWDPTVGVDADGDFVITWSSIVEGNGQTDV